MAEFPRIEDHGIIGDMKTVALVSLNGNIDFMCYPDFDSPTIFAALLDPDKGGAFSFSPLMEKPRRRQLYLPDTNILITRFLCSDGVAEISDFMPVDGFCRIVRRAKSVLGENKFSFSCAPKPDYARSTPRVEKTDYGALFVSGDQNYRLYSSVTVELRDGEAAGEFTLSEGQHAYLVFEAESTEVEKPEVNDDYVVRSFKETSNYWRGWLSRSSYSGRWREMVSRSALALKLLQHRDHGSFVAAATFGLPEAIGGERNWDYRYSWIRDAAFTLYALMRLGFTDEAVAFEEWLFSRAGECSEDGSMQIMYGIDGRNELPEMSLDHLRGYRDSRPVLIGNAAHDQLQLDIYGELMDAMYLANKYARRVHRDPWNRLVRIVEYVSRNWDRPDEGIWEVRGGRRKFLSSRLMCWVAVDRAFRMALKNSLPAPLENWSAVRNEIHESIYRDFWNKDLGAFVQYAGSSALDASVLLMPLVRFISPTDPYWLSTMRVVKDRLVKDCLVLRYDNEAESVDGLAGVEGTFTTCAFWYVESLARSGDVQQARFFFEKMLSYANHLGLYSEELSPAGEHLGNFPQALTHLALISAAYALNKAMEDSWK